MYECMYCIISNKIHYLENTEYYELETALNIPLKYSFNKLLRQ